MVNFAFFFSFFSLSFSLHSDWAAEVSLGPLLGW
jgi:hypothetical protein